jgi:hypothetical protein
MPRRNSKGRFVKKSGSRPRRRRRASGYTTHTGGHTPHAPAAAQPRRRRRRRAKRMSAHAPRARARRGRSRRGGARPVIVVANAPRGRGRGRRRYAKAPPMFTFGGMAVFGVGMFAGYEVANCTGRYFEGIDPSVTPAPTLPSGITTVQQYNELVQAAAPSFKKTGIELLIAALGFLVGAFARGPLLKLFGYGWGFGGLAHIGGALLDGYIIRPMFATGAAAGTAGTLSNTGQRMWQHEQTAASAKATAVQAGGATLGAPPGYANKQIATKVGTPAGGGQAAPQMGPRRQPPVMLAQRTNPFQQQQQQTQVQQTQVQQQTPITGQSATVPAGYVYVTAGNTTPTDNGNGTITCPGGGVYPTGTPCPPPAYIVLGNGFVQPNGTPVPTGATVQGYWYAPPSLSTTPPIQGSTYTPTPTQTNPPPQATGGNPQPSGACGDPPDEPEKPHPMKAMRALDLSQRRNGTLPLPMRSRAA